MHSCCNFSLTPPAPEGSEQDIIDRNFTKFERLFGRYFEYARRHKIMNPGTTSALLFLVLFQTF